GGAFTGRALRGDAAAVAVGNLAANGQTDAGPLVSRAAVQPLEEHEYAVEIFFVRANAVVLDRNPAKPVGLLAAGGGFGRQAGRLAADFDERRPAFLVKLQSVDNQVLEHLAHLQRIRVKGRQLAQV